MKEKITPLYSLKKQAQCSSVQFFRNSDSKNCLRKIEKTFTVMIIMMMIIIIIVLNNLSLNFLAYLNFSCMLLHLWMYDSSSPIM